jgi:hypothetical protein
LALTNNNASGLKLMKSVLCLSANKIPWRTMGNLWKRHLILNKLSTITANPPAKNNIWKSLSLITGAILTIFKKLFYHIHERVIFKRSKYVKIRKSIFWTT